MNKERIEWIDVLKGIGITSVVIGHVAVGFTQALMYLFHMPLFFFIGGMLLTPSSDIRTFFQKKVIHLLIPYLAFLIILYTKDMLLVIKSFFEAPSVYSFVKLLVTAGKGLYGGTELTGWTSVFWFVTCFFLTQQIFNFLHQKLNQKTIYLIPLLLSLGYLNAAFIPSYSFPWNVNVVLVALPFFIVGFYFGKLQLKKQIYTISAILSLLSVVLIARGYEISFNMKYSHYGIPYVSFLLSIAAIICLIGISKLCTRFVYLKRSLAFLGTASMIIMYLHSPLKLTAAGIPVLNHGWTKFTLGMVIPIVCYQLLNQRQSTRAVFLGSYHDFITSFKMRLPVDQPNQPLHAVKSKERFDSR